MDLVKDDDRQTFIDDLKIFCYEMYHYFIARCFWHKKYPKPIPVTENSEFTEEFGKAVIVVWHKRAENFKRMLNQDFPRYAERTDNFKNYVVITVKEIINKPDMTQTQQIILVTAFLFNIYFHCYINRQDGCLPYFVEFWSQLFLSLFYKEFDKDNGWQKLREECLGFSKKYDKTEAEEPTDNFTVLKFRIKYFQQDVNVKVPNSSYSLGKSVSRFYIISRTLKKILPPDHPGKIRERQETLNIIFGTTMQEENDKLYTSDKVNFPSNNPGKSDASVKSL